MAEAAGRSRHSRHVCVVLDARVVDDEFCVTDRPPGTPGGASLRRESGAKKTHDSSTAYFAFDVPTWKTRLLRSLMGMSSSFFLIHHPSSKEHRQLLVSVVTALVERTRPLSRHVVFGAATSFA